MERAAPIPGEESKYGEGPHPFPVRGAAPHLRPHVICLLCSFTASRPMNSRRAQAMRPQYWEGRRYGSRHHG
jgi:hypothetical protein